MLKSLATRLADAGLDRVTVSLDSWTTRSSAT